MSRDLPEKSRRGVLDRSGGLCEAGLPGCCWIAADIHHVKLRSRGGSDDIKNLLAVCRPCHQRITDNKPGTERFRTFRWQEEVRRETDFGALESRASRTKNK